MLTLFTFISFIIGKPFYRFLSFVSVVSVVWFLAKWGPSRACVQAVSPLFHVINMNTPSWGSPFSCDFFFIRRFYNFICLVSIMINVIYRRYINIVPTSSKSSTENWNIYLWMLKKYDKQYFEMERKTKKRHILLRKYVCMCTVAKKW